MGGLVPQTCSSGVMGQQFERWRCAGPGCVLLQHRHDGSVQRSAFFQWHEVIDCVTGQSMFETQAGAVSLEQEVGLGKGFQALVGREPKELSYAPPAR